MKFLCALIVVEDIKRSRHLYENVLGQTVKTDFGENICFEGDFALHQSKHFQSLINNRQVMKGANNFELCFEYNDLQDIADKIKDLGLELVHDIMEQPWKQQVFRFYDYDKNIIEVGEEMEHVAFRLSQQDYSLNEICKITYLPKEAVERVLTEYSRKEIS